MRQMGHSNISQTFNTYAHLFRSTSRDAMTKLDRLMAQPEALKAGECSRSLLSNAIVMINEMGARTPRPRW